MVLGAEELQIVRVVAAKGVRADRVDVVAFQGVLPAALRATAALASQEQVVVLPARLPFRLQEVEERGHGDGRESLPSPGHVEVVCRGFDRRPVLRHFAHHYLSSRELFNCREVH